MWLDVCVNTYGLTNKKTSVISIFTRKWNFDT